MTMLNSYQSRNEYIGLEAFYVILLVISLGLINLCDPNERLIMLLKLRSTCTPLIYMYYSTLE